MRQTKKLASQRRFLILMSIAVIAFFHLGASIVGEGTVQGFTFRFSRPDNLPPLLWFVWLWSFVRYLQLMNASMPAIRRNVSRNVDRYDDEIASRIALKRARSLAADGKLDVQAGNRPKYPVMDVRAVVLRPDTPIGEILDGRRRPNPVFTLENGGRRYRAPVAHYHYDTQRNSTGFDYARFDFELSRASTWIVRRRAEVQAVFWLPHVGEYIFPVVIGLAAFGYILVEAF